MEHKGYKLRHEGMLVKISRTGGAGALPVRLSGLYTNMGFAKDAIDRIEQEAVHAREVNAEKARAKSRAKADATNKARAKKKELKNAEEHPTTGV